MDELLASPKGIVPASADQFYDGRTGSFAALPAPQIKPLVWVKGTARSPIAVYTVAETDNDDDPFWFIYIDGKPAGKLGEHPNEESAKAAVWAHHTATIRAALVGTEGGE